MPKCLILSGIPTSGKSTFAKKCGFSILSCDEIRKELKEEKLVWDKSHHGNIHLFGHSHGTLPMHGKSMDVGVDTNNFYPYHLDEILDIMKNIKPEIIDHHNEKTT